MSELAGWEGFYAIVGSAAGVLIGLQFVVMTLIADRPRKGLEEASAAFGTPTIVHFGAVLLLAALLRVPWPTITIVAAVWGLLAVSGVAYAIIATQRIRKQATYRPDFEDWLFHVVLPVAAYAILALSAVAAPSRPREALFGVGVAALLLLFSGIHNAWDSVTYHVLVTGRDANTDRRGDETSGKETQ